LTATKFEEVDTKEKEKEKEIESLKNINAIDFKDKGSDLDKENKDKNFEQQKELNKDYKGHDKKQIMKKNESV